MTEPILTNLLTQLVQKNCDHIIHQILQYLDFQDFPQLYKIFNEHDDDDDFKLFHNILINYENTKMSPLKMFTNTIFVRDPLIHDAPRRYDIGNASFHFSRDFMSYLNFSRSAQKGFTDDNGKSLGIMRMMNNMEVSCDGIIKFTVDWREDPRFDTDFIFKGCNFWEFELSYDKDKDFLVGEQRCYMKGPNDDSSRYSSTPLKIYKFPDDKLYRKLPEEDVHLINASNLFYYNKNNPLKMYYRCVYVQSRSSAFTELPTKMTLSKASYHLETIDCCYIYYGPFTNWKLDNDENFPARKYFKNVYIDKDDYFNGTICWKDDHNTTVDGEDTWVYRFKQERRCNVSMQEQCENCLIGTITTFLDGEERSVSNFGVEEDGLFYSKWEELFA